MISCITGKIHYHKFMKNRIVNGNCLEFFDATNSKKGEIKVSGSDIIINPVDSTGTVIFGEEGAINDIEIGASGERGYVSDIISLIDKKKKKTHFLKIFIS